MRLNISALAKYPKQLNSIVFHFALVGVLLTTGCSKKETKNQDIVIKPTSASHSSEAMQPPSNASIMTSAKPVPASEFVGPAKLSTTKQKDTVGHTGGILIGTPFGWDAESVYNSYDLAYTKKPNEAFVLYEKASGGLQNFGDFKEDHLNYRAYIAHLTKATWGKPFDTVVGEGKYPAKVIRGKGTALVSSLGEMNAMAIVFQVPKKSAGFVLATWLVSKPEREENIREMLRAIAPCDFKPGKGCVKNQ
jgi:hypothetical protein